MLDDGVHDGLNKSDPDGGEWCADVRVVVC